MKCPYQNFADCIVQQCPACNYVTHTQEVTAGREPYTWEELKTTYEFVSCKLVDTGVQPVLQQERVVNHNTRVNTIIHKSLL